MDFANFIDSDFEKSFGLGLSSSARLELCRISELLSRKTNFHFSTRDIERSLKNKIFEWLLDASMYNIKKVGSVDTGTGVLERRAVSWTQDRRRFLFFGQGIVFYYVDRGSGLFSKSERF